jgi:hypothetical protein
MNASARQLFKFFIDTKSDLDECRVGLASVQEELASKEEDMKKTVGYEISRYICMHIFIYVCIYMNRCMYVYIYIDILMYIHIRIYMCIYIYMHLCVYICIYIFICM